MPSHVLPILLLSASGILLSGCGEGPPSRVAPPGRGAASAPGGPEATSSQLFRGALAEGRVEEAWEALERLAADGDGGVDIGGRTLSRDVALAALHDAAVEAVRARLEGAHPDGDATERALRVAFRTATPRDRPRVEGLRRWVAADSVDGLPGTLAPHEGPRVLLYVDHFQLGEALLRDVAAGWARSGRAGLLRVSLVPILRGHVRAGLRRLAATPDAERAALRERAEEAGLEMEGPPLDAEAARRNLGLADQESALVVVARDGRIVGRLSGTMLDPRRLARKVERVASR